MSHASARGLLGWILLHTRPFVGDWLWALVGLAAPTLLQLAFLVVAARALDVIDFGNFLLLLSVVMVAVSLLGFGSSGVVLKMAARDPAQATHHFGQALALIGVSAVVLFPIVVVASWFMTKGHLDLTIILMVSAAELLAFRTIQTGSSLFIGFGTQARSSLMLVTGPLARLLAALLTLTWPEPTRLWAFAGLYSGLILAAGGFCLVYVVKTIGLPRLSVKSYRYWDGFTFSLTDLNAILQTESDKLILGALSTPSSVAIYTVASRLADGAAMPVRALRMSVHARLFQEGSGGGTGSLRLTLRLLPLIVGYGLLTWVAFVMAAPLVVSVFGDGYGQLSSVLPLFGLLPLLRAIAEFGAEIFVTSDRPGLQVLLQGCSVPLRLVIGYALVSAFGLEGAVVTALSTMALLSLALWIAVFAVVGGSGRSSQA